MTMKNEQDPRRVRDAGRMIAQAHDNLESMRRLLNAAHVILSEEIALGLDDETVRAAHDHLVKSMPIEDHLVALLPDSETLVMFGRAAEKGVAA